MIIIAGQVVDSSTLSREYVKGSMDQELVDMMSNSEEEFRYDSSDQLNFEMTLRNEIVQAALALSNSGLYFATFRNTRVNTRYWYRGNDGGFVLKNDANPSSAIEDIYRNGSLYATECATAMMIIYYKALLAVYGEETFNRLFPRIRLMNWHYLDPLLVEVGSLRGTSQYLLGDRRYIANPDVNPATPQWQGENVIDLGNGMYYGHGVGIKSVPEIIKSLNRARRPNAKRSAYLMDRVGIPNFNKLYNAMQQ